MGVEIIWALCIGFGIGCTTVFIAGSLLKDDAEIQTDTLLFCGCDISGPARDAVSDTRNTLDMILQQEAVSLDFVQSVTRCRDRLQEEFALENGRVGL